MKFSCVAYAICATNTHTNWHSITWTIPIQSWFNYLELFRKIAPTNRELHISVPLCPHSLAIWMFSHQLHISRSVLDCLFDKRLPVNRVIIIYLILFPIAMLFHYYLFCKLEYENTIPNRWLYTGYGFVVPCASACSMYRFSPVNTAICLIIRHIRIYRPGKSALAHIDRAKRKQATEEEKKHAKMHNIFHDVIRKCIFFLLQFTQSGERQRQMYKKEQNRTHKHIFFYSSCVLPLTEDRNWVWTEEVFAILDSVCVCVCVRSSSLELEAKETIRECVLSSNKIIIVVEVEVVRGQAAFI